MSNAALAIIALATLCWMAAALVACADGQISAGITMLILGAAVLLILAVAVDSP